MSEEKWYRPHPDFTVFYDLNEITKEEADEYFQEYLESIELQSPEIFK